jgi:hypothetical protein
VCACGVSVRVYASLHSLSTTSQSTQGEYAAAFANVRALSVIGAPLLYSGVYARTAPYGKGGYAFYASALTIVLAELLHRSLSDKECYPKAANKDAKSK